MKTGKQYVSFAAGMVTMALLVGLIGGSLATENQTPNISVATAAHPAGTMTGKPLDGVYSGQAGLALFGKEKVAPGTARTTTAGTSVPTVLSYVDEKGMENYYVSVEAVEELLDVALGVTYNEELNCVDFGTKLLLSNGETYPMTAEPGYSIASVRKNGVTTVTGVGNKRGSATVSTGDVFITVGGDLEELSPEEEARQQARIERLRKTSTMPEYGVTMGAFTEVDPAEVDQATYLGSFMDQDTFQSADEVRHTFAFAPLAGTYVTLTIENQVKDDVLARVERPYTVGD